MLNYVIMAYIYIFLDMDAICTIQRQCSIRTGHKVSCLFELTSLLHVSYISFDRSPHPLPYLAQSPKSCLKELVVSTIVLCHYCSFKDDFFYCLSYQLDKQIVIPYHNSESTSVALFDFINLYIWGPSPTSIMGTLNIFAICQ